MRAKLVQKWRVKTLAALCLAGTMAFSTGCERPDWENPDYVARMLEEGDERQRREAVSTLRNFPEERRAEIAPALAQIYLQDAELRGDVMQHLIQWRKPGAVAAYVEEMKTDQTGNGEFAAETLGRLESRESVPAMLEAFAATNSDTRRDGILRGLARMPDPSVVDVALEVLYLDVDNHRITMHSNTCDMVGNLALEHPEAISDDLKKALIRAVFLSDEVGRQIAGECRLAVQKVGQAMTPQLIELFNQENQEVERLLMTYEQSTDGYQFPFNRAKHEATVLLTAIRAPEAVDLFLADLQAEKEVDSSYSLNRRQSWLRQEGAALNEMIHSLGDLGDPKARPLLERILRGELADSTWKGLIDDRGDFQFRQDAATALSKIGDRQARPALLRAVRAEIIPIMARRFAAVEQQGGEAVPDLEKYRPQWRAAAAYAYLAEAGDRGAFETMTQGLPEGEFREKVASFGAAFDVMDECAGKEDAAERAKCFGKFIESGDEVKMTKAIYELSRMSTEAAGPIIAEAIKTRDLDTRELVTFAGYRVPTEALAANIEALLDSESGRSSREYRRDHLRLRMLHGFIQTHEPQAMVAEE